MRPYRRHDTRRWTSTCSIRHQQLNIDFFFNQHSSATSNGFDMTKQTANSEALVQTSLDSSAGYKAASFFDESLFIFSIRVFYREVPGFLTDCSCGVWCHKSTASSFLILTRILCRKVSLRQAINL